MGGQGVAEDAVMFASINRKLENIEKFLEKVPDFALNCPRPGCGATTIHSAAFAGCKDSAMKSLVAHGGNVHLKNGLGHNALAFAAGCKDSDPELVRSLVASGCDVNQESWATNAMFKTFCFTARMKTYAGSADSFYRSLAMSQGAAPVHMAVYNGQIESAKLLVELGADLTKKTTWATRRWTWRRSSTAKCPPSCARFSARSPRRVGAAPAAARRARRSSPLWLRMSTWPPERRFRTLARRRTSGERGVERPWALCKYIRLISSIRRAFSYVHLSYGTTAW